jgi:hypothetical protein
MKAAVVDAVGAGGLGGFAARALIHENQLVKIPIEMPKLADPEITRIVITRF